MTIENVCILDAGGQFTKVIDRRLRELNVHSQIMSTSTPPEKLKLFKAIIISGGPSSVFRGQKLRIFFLFQFLFVPDSVMSP